jgi:sporulation-control protein spo0M
MAKAQVTVQLDSPYYSTGGTVRARVYVGGELDEKVRGGRVELRYVNTYRKEERDTRAGNNTSTTRNVTRTDEVVVQSIALTPPGGQLLGEHDIELPVPGYAPPSAEDLVEWSVRGIVDREQGFDARADAGFTLLSRRADAPRGIRQDADSQVSLQLDQDAVCLGGAITGAVTVDVREATKVTDIRVELKALRQDEDGISSEWTVSRVELGTKATLEPGQPQSFAFELQVPTDAVPSLTAAHNSVHHVVEAIAARRLRRDYNTSTPIAVFSDPASDGAA